ncbi:hypothetical protein, partial [Mesorhizobium sp. M4B.F.Ca.ET.049.02.1.2]|uniref:hypothetical protein n=1 Tax=Mesorhizobium sp. M4B.F.Ca.ET.049.02.1.2 TaxID=2496752 RepID=UPI001AECEDA4
ELDCRDRYNRLNIMLIGPDGRRNGGEFHAVQVLLTFPQTLVSAYLIAGGFLRIAAVRGQ